MDRGAAHCNSHPAVRAPRETGISAGRDGNTGLGRITLVRTGSPLRKPDGMETMSKNQFRTSRLWPASFVFVVVLLSCGMVATSQTLW